MLSPIESESKYDSELDLVSKIRPLNMKYKSSSKIKPLILPAIIIPDEPAIKKPKLIVGT